MFPLGTVLFPHAVLPLHVFEPRYRALTRHVLDGDQEFGIVLIERGSEVGGGDVRFGIGTLAHIVQAAELADGRFALAVVGVSRVKVERWLPEAPFPQAEVTELAEPAVAPGDVAALLDDAHAALRTVHELALQLQGGGEMPELPAARGETTDPEQAAFEIAALAALGPLDAQRVLELPDTPARLRALHLHLTETAVMLRARLAGS